MIQTKTYSNCKCFSIRNLCPHREDELMKQFVMGTHIPESSVPIQIDFSKEDEINKICSSCNKFKAR
jgi:hypothetical protein